MTTTTALAPRCVRCSKRHIVTLPCWRGRYSTGKTRHTLATKGKLCWLCGLDGADTADHVVPRSRFGTDDDDNLMPAHGRCNKTRGNQPHDEYAARIAASALVDGSRKWLTSAPAPLPAPLTRDRPPTSPTRAHRHPRTAKRRGPLP